MRSVFSLKDNSMYSSYHIIILGIVVGTAPSCIRVLLYLVGLLISIKVNCW